MKRVPYRPDRSYPGPQGCKGVSAWVCVAPPGCKLYPSVTLKRKKENIEKRILWMREDHQGPRKVPLLWRSERFQRTAD